ncbi:MAG TPA: hypothetical protein VFN24_00405 [Microbacterium sp.]|nr:hypothetical protein [Microbacterium sp.]
MRLAYPAIILVLTVVAPIVNVIVVLAASGWTADPWPVIGSAFVFWAVGIRLLTAGLSQILRPGFTSEGILGAKDGSANQIVQELGAANVGMGAIGLIATLWLPAWIPAAALAGGFFLGFAGLRHVAKKGKGLNEAVATYTDIFVALVLAVYLIVMLVRALQ